MICKECGKKVSKNHLFCENCGAKIELKNDTTVADKVNEEKENRLKENKLKENKLKENKLKNISNKINIKKILPILIGVAVIIMIALIISFSKSIFNSDENYLILEKEDELIIYENDKEVLELDYEGEYYFTIYEGKFVLMDQSGDDGAYALYIGKVSEKSDVEEVSDNVYSYDFGGETIAYIEYEDDEQVLYVGDFYDLDTIEEVDDEVLDVWVSSDGKGVYYTNIDNNVYSYINGDSDKIAKDARISFVGEDANQVILVEDIDEEEQTLVWYKKGDDFELAESVDVIQYSDFEKLSLAYIGDWDADKGCGTLYYADKFGKDPIEIDDDVSDFSFENYYTEDYREACEYIFYVKDKDMYVTKVGAEGEGEQFLDMENPYDILAYDAEFKVILWYEHDKKDEIYYYNIETGEDNSIDLDDEFVYVEYADDIIVYENADKEVMYVGSEGETEIINNMVWKLVDSRYIFAVVGEGEENESYIYDMIEGEEILLAEGMNDVQMIDDMVYALGDYDMEKEEGTVYRLKLGKEDPIEMDDDVKQIWTIKN